MPSQPSQFTPYLIVIPVVLLILVLRLRSMSRGRALRLEWLWVTPVLMLVFAALLLVQAPPQGLQWAWLVLPIVVGAAVGFYRGRMMHISVDPETHALSAKASPAALYFIVGIMVLRSALNFYFRDQAAAWGINPLFFTDLFMAFAIGMFGMQRVEMFVRARRLLGEARAARAAAG